MKRIGKPVFFIVFVIILALAYTSVFGIYGENGDFKITYIKGINDIRWGIDINGGVEAVFAPDGKDATDAEMESVKAILELRLVAQNVTDYEVYPDYSNDRITIRFPWKSDEKDYDPDTAIKELSATAKLTFRGGSTADGEVIIEGSDVKRAYSNYQSTSEGTHQHVVVLELNDEGKTKFADGTQKYFDQQIGIWMDEELVSAPKVSSVITDGIAIISGSFDAAGAAKLANTINAGALPFGLKVESYSTLSGQFRSDSDGICCYHGIVSDLPVHALYVSPARLYRLYRSARSNGNLHHGDLRLFPCLPQLYNDHPRYCRHDSLHWYGR